MKRGLLQTMLGLSLLLPSLAFASQGQGTPDTRPSADETICDGYKGSAYGLCVAYCYATDCADGVNVADQKACDGLIAAWTATTGQTFFPCESE